MNPFNITHKSADTILRTVAELTRDEDKAMVIQVREASGARLELGLCRRMYMQCLKEGSMDVVRADFKNRIGKMKSIEDVVMVMPSYTPSKEMGYLMVYANKSGLWALGRHPQKGFREANAEEKMIFHAFTGLDKVG